MGSTTEVYHISVASLSFFTCFAKALAALASHSCHFFLTFLTKSLAASACQICALSSSVKPEPFFTLTFSQARNGVLGCVKGGQGSLAPPREHKAACA